MKKICSLLLILSLLSLMQSVSFAGWQRTTDSKSNKNYIEGELLVRFKDTATAQATRNVNATVGATVLHSYEHVIGKWQHLKLPEGMTTDAGLATYRSFPEVEMVQPNFIYRVDVTPNDPQFGSMYGMTKISAPTAWDTTTGGTSIIVADIDTGTDYNHQDLAANMWHNPGEIPGNNIDDDQNGFIDDDVGYDFYNNDPSPLDGHGHGTHTSGTIAAVGNNGVGVVGVNWTTRLMSLKTHADNGDSSSAVVIAAFNYVTMMKNRGINIRVTSNSWGGAPEAASYDQALKDAIDAAGNAGVLNVFAAGNNGSNNDSTPFYPATYNSPSIVSVASSDSADNRSGFSNFGLTTVDIAAPGSGILSTFPGNQYGSISGTSMATPHVAGAAVLLLTANPNLSVASLKATLMNRVDQLANWTNLVASGGRLNVANALTNQTTCSFNLSQASQNFAAAGGSGSVNLTTNSTACSWGAFSNAAWIMVTSASGGSGNTTVNFSVAQNLGSARAGTITIGGQTFTVNQAGVSTCTYSLSNGSQNFTSGGGSGSFNVITQTACNWTASPNANWVSITSG
ncbi:MAG: S8 family serine peptidase, partial [Acidobacteriota bacterium]